MSDQGGEEPEGYAESAHGADGFHKGKLSQEWPAPLPGNAGGPAASN
jgi:hypothetical protein